MIHLLNNLQGRSTATYYSSTVNVNKYYRHYLLSYHIRTCPTGTSQVKPVTYGQECAVTNNSGGKLSCKDISLGTVIDESVSGSSFKFNFRFPEQYFDIETGLNYNINRDYNPVLGKIHDK